MAEYVFTGVYRSFLVTDPAKQLKKFSWIGDFFFQEARKLETDIVSDSRCVVRYSYEQGASPTRSICESLIGFWSRTLELSGVSKVKPAHTTCVTRGAERCEFVFDLEPASLGGD
jgi:predicted hydrocarbon binding protein